MNHTPECQMRGDEPDCAPACPVALVEARALQASRVALFRADAKRLAAFPPESVDALVCDPPAGIAFMGKTWDQDHGGRAEWVAGMAAVFRAVLAALKPGAHGLVWALPRTSHWTATALEDAGFEVRDVVDHLFGTGFPKSLDVSKAIDKAAGAERAVTVAQRRAGADTRTAAWGYGEDFERRDAPATDAAKRWAGWGTALKPGKEHWILVRKPLVGTVAANVLAHGTGAINVDGCRVATADDRGRKASGGKGGGAGTVYGESSLYDSESHPGGRWPANVILSHGPGCEPVGPVQVPANGSTTGTEPSAAAALHGNALPRLEWRAHGNGDGTETVQAWSCAPGCPVAELDAQSGTRTSGTKVGGQYARDEGIYGGGQRTDGIACYADAGGASRYYTTLPPEAEADRLAVQATVEDILAGSGFTYAAKPSRAERDAGCAHLPLRVTNEDTPPGTIGAQSPRAGANRSGAARNHHPTVKSQALMRYLCRLITPPGGTVLDPFTGSGSTGVAALAEGFRFVGFEREAEYVEIAKARLAHALKGTP